MIATYLFVFQVPISTGYQPEHLAVGHSPNSICILSNSFTRNQALKLGPTSTLLAKDQPNQITLGHFYNVVHPDHI